MSTCLMHFCVFVLNLNKNVIGWLMFTETYMQIRLQDIWKLKETVSQALLLTILFNMMIFAQKLNIDMVLELYILFIFIYVILLKG